MNLPRSEKPLRRSAVGSFRFEGEERGIMQNNELTQVSSNDDESERRESRGQTLVRMQERMSMSPLESIEENETIRKCLEIYNGNKLSKDNAWNLSLIDTLSTLLSRHHKALKNFTVAGFLLEASSKVYGLRVDSIYLDAMRMAAGLNAKTLTAQQLNAADRDDSIQEGTNPEADNQEQQTAVAPQQKQKKARKVVSTVTKNKETLNARLETVSLLDPVFGKLNSSVGSFCASDRMMHNILPTRNSELLLRSTYKFWDSEELDLEIPSYEELCEQHRNVPSEQLVNAEWVRKLLPHVDKCILRTMHTGYHITDTPNPRDKQGEKEPEAPRDLSVAFDMNAECEPIPDDDVHMQEVVDFKDAEEFSQEEQIMLNQCRNSKKKPMIIEDLRPVDGSSKLEYSYRPMDQISQYWAGPSYWKFKRVRPRTTFGQRNAQRAVANPRSRVQRAAQPGKSLTFEEEPDDDSFEVIDANTKLRKVNFQTWDARKLMLPTKFDIPEDYFFTYDLAPGLEVKRRFVDAEAEELEEQLDLVEREEKEVELFDNELFAADAPGSPLGKQLPKDSIISGNDASQLPSCNNTVLEIPNDFVGAPAQVTKIVLPFAKRAKVIDMKNLKLNCNFLIQKQLLAHVTEGSILAHPVPKSEKYVNGVASFQEMYKKLPSLCSTKTADSLSVPLALYAVLHLAIEQRLRLIPQKDLKDFQIRQIGEKEETQVRKF